MAKAATFVTGLVVGSIAGGVIALLASPRSGREFRAQVKDQAVRAQERAQELRATGMERMQTAMESGRQALGRTRQGIGERTHEWTQRRQQADEQTG